MATFQRRLRFDPSRCIGCRSCQVACARQLMGSNNPRMAAIRVPAPHENSEALVCRQCREPACMESCDMNAIYRRGGVVLIDYDSCEGCGLCVKACPYHAMFWVERLRRPLKCTMCDGGSAKCVEACPTGALCVVEEPW